MNKREIATEQLRNYVSSFVVTPQIVSVFGLFVCKPQWFIQVVYNFVKLHQNRFGSIEGPAANDDDDDDGGIHVRMWFVITSVKLALFPAVRQRRHCSCYRQHLKTTWTLWNIICFNFMGPHFWSSKFQSNLSIHNTFYSIFVCEWVEMTENVYEEFEKLTSTR